MANQPIPFKEHSTVRKDDADVPARPPGEIGGHTVQPWEVDPTTPTTSTPTTNPAANAAGATSKDVLPPQAGTAEANAPGTGPGMTTTKAPGNKPSSAPGETRPARPPVYAPQAGHEPAPRPPTSHVPAGAGATNGDQLVEAITKAIAENLAKALHQSVAQAVRDAMPLSAKSVDQGAPVVPGAGKDTGQAPVAQRGPVAKPEANATPPGRSETETPQPPAAKPATEATPRAAGEAQAGGGEQRSQYGGTIEPPTGAAPAAADAPSQEAKAAETP